MKKFLIFVFFILSLANIFALSVKDGMIYDSNGWSAELKEYNSIIVIDPSTVETSFLIGGENKIKAIGHTSSSPIWPYDKTPDIESVGTITKPSLEKVLFQNPDLVIINGMITDFGVTLRDRGIPVLTVSPDTLDEILDNAEIFGIIFGKEKESIILAQEKKSLLREIKKEIKNNPLNLKGAFLYSTNPIMGFNSDSMAGEVLRIIGVENITDGVTGERPILSPEYILKENPDFLLGAMSIRKTDDILNANPMIKNTRAGKNKNIFIVDSSKILRPSPRLVEEIVILYKELSEIN
ncbi:MAG: ABC transporter substrate-binding protein [Thermotogae bacterium]|nr:ABC transporter substrate-binding protein [Thermotogota bacterium]